MTNRYPDRPERIPGSEPGRLILSVLGEMALRRWRDEQHVGRLAARAGADLFFRRAVFMEGAILPPFRYYVLI